MQNQTLPNIKSTSNGIYFRNRAIFVNTISAPFYNGTTSETPQVLDFGSTKEASTVVNFNASYANPIYRDYANVLPKNYSIKVWKRIS